MEKKKSIALILRFNVEKAQLVGPTNTNSGRKSTKNTSQSSAHHHTRASSAHTHTAVRVRRCHRGARGACAATAAGLKRT